MKASPATQKKETKSTTMTVRIAPALRKKLEALSRDTKRSKAYLTNAAIASYVAREAWQIARIKASLAEAESGAPGISHEDMGRWIQSWDTDNELPPPKPRR